MGDPHGSYLPLALASWVTDTTALYTVVTTKYKLVSLLLTET